MSTVLDKKDRDDDVCTVAWILAILGIVIYLTFNIIGTVYYAKLQKSDCFTSSEKGGALASVFLGWLLAPIVNITSPIMYASNPGCKMERIVDK
jgi:hypothetical protein